MVIPTWNRLPLLEEAIASVIAQSYSHWELIVVDDGSTDGTVERLRRFSDSRLRLVASHHIGHIGRVRNIGAESGSGDLIAFLDSDDLWFPRKLELQVGALTESDAGWCYSRYELMDQDRRQIPLRPDWFVPLSGDVLRELLTRKATVLTPTVVIRRKVFDAAGRFSEDPRLSTGEDYELYLRLALHAHAVAVPDTLARIREHPGRTTANGVNPHELLALIYDLFLAYNPEGKYSDLARRLRSRSLADAGAQQLAVGDLHRATLLFSGSVRRGVDLSYWARALTRGVRDGVLRRLGHRSKR